MHDTGVSETERRDSSRRPASARGITLGTCLVIVAAIGAECGLVVQIRKVYAAVPPFAQPVCPEAYATPVVLLWIILGSLASFAWRRWSVTRLATQVAVSCALVMSQFWVPVGAGVPGAGYEILWPVACFGVFFVAPLLLHRFSRAGDWVLVLSDSSVVALLTYVFAVQPYLPKL